MAKKPPKGRAGGRARNKNDLPKGVADPKKTQTILKVPNGNDVRNAVKKCESMKKGVQSEVGKLGDYVADLVEKKNFDKKAFAQLRVFCNIPEDKFQRIWLHFKKMADDMGFDERGTDQAEFALEGSDGAQSEANFGDKGDGKVVSIGSAARDVVEKAGEAAGAH